MHTCHVSMEAMRLTCSDYQKMMNISKKYIPEMSLSEDKIVNLLSSVRDPHLTCIKLLTRKQKTPTAGASAKRIRLPSVRQQKQKTPTAGASAERIRLLSIRQQKPNALPTAGTSAVRITLSSVWQQ